MTILYTFLRVLFHKRAFAFVFCAFIVQRAFAQFDYGTGAEGAYTAPVGASNLSGTHNYTTFTIPAGSTVTVTGDAPLIIKCLGAATIDGTLTGAANAGGPGPSGYAGSSAPAGPAGTGGGGGWGASGGVGGIGTTYSVATGTSNGANGGKFSTFNGNGIGGTYYSGAFTETAGTGGSYGTQGLTAPSTTYSPGNSSVGVIYSDVNLTAIATVNLITTNLLGGCGGGGGGARCQTVNNGAIWGGCGGGGGGGAIRITANSISFGSGSLLSVRGGDGGADNPHGVGAGGGGSGGTVNLQYAVSLAGVVLNTTPVFVAGSTIDYAGGIGGSAGSGYTIAGDGGQGRYLAQLDSATCAAPALTAMANGIAGTATICSGALTLTANPSGGTGCTGSIEYAWSDGVNYWNGSSFVSGSPVYNGAYSSITASATVNKSYTSTSRCSADTSCTGSSVVTVNVTDYVSAGVSITAIPPGIICSGTTVAFIAVPVNGGTPVYQWKKNSVNVGTNKDTYLDSTLNNNDTVICVMTSGLNCVTGSPATSDSILVQVDAKAVAGTITTDKNAICSGTTDSMMLNGSAGNIQWQQSATDGNFTNIPEATTTSYAAMLTQTTYFRAFASNGICPSDTSVVFQLTVNPAPPIPVITTIGFTLYCSTDTAYTSYQWYDSTAIIPGATDTMLVITQGGNYNVQVTNSDSCKIAVGINILLTGITPFITNNTFSIFPNPLTSSSTLQLYTPLKNAEVIIYDLPGKEIMSKRLNGNSMEIERGSLESGVYFVKVIDGAGQYVQKIVVE